MLICGEKTSCLAAANSRDRPALAVRHWRQVISGRRRPARRRYGIGCLERMLGAICQVDVAADLTVIQPAALADDSERQAR